MTNEEYKLISNAIADMGDKIINSIERNTKETIDIINLTTQNEE